MGLWRLGLYGGSEQPTLYGRFVDASGLPTGPVQLLRDDFILGMYQREVLAAQLLARLRAVAVPGLTLRTARLVGPDELRLGQLVAAADYAVQLPEQAAERLAQTLPERLSGTLTVERTRHKKKRRGRRRGGGRPQTQVIDIKSKLLDVAVTGSTLRFRLSLDGEGGARPREVVQALVGERVPDHRMTRTRLLVRKGEVLEGIDEVGACPRPPPRPRTAAADAPAPPELAQ